MGDVFGEVLNGDARFRLAHVLLAEHQLVEGDITPGIERNFLDGLCHVVSP